MRPFDIYFAEFQWNGCKDRRPWLIIEKGVTGGFNCFPISGQDYPGKAFRLDQDHPDFAATGLTKACFIHDERFYCLQTACFKNRKGTLTGELLARFLAYSGLKPQVDD